MADPVEKPADTGGGDMRIFRQGLAGESASVPHLTRLQDYPDGIEPGRRTTDAGLSSTLPEKIRYTEHTTAGGTQGTAASVDHGAAAHEHCACSNATSGNVDIILTIA